MRGVGSLVRLPDGTEAVIEKVHSPSHWVVSYIKWGVRCLQRVPKVDVYDRKEEK